MSTLCVSMADLPSSEEVCSFEAERNGHHSPQSSNQSDDSNNMSQPGGTYSASYEMFENPTGLSHDLRYLAGMPELCDVIFLVGDNREPVYAVKAILAIRSRVFHKMLFGPRASVAMTPVKNLPGTIKEAHTPAQTAGKRSLSRVIFGTSPFRQNAKLTHPLFSANPECEATKALFFINDFDVEVFRQLIHYLHTGVALLQSKTVIGLMNAADHYGLEELRHACIQYSQKCISLESVCYLLTSAERYIQYKSTKMLVQRVLEYVEQHGEAVLNLQDLVQLPRHVVDLILSREDLQATELAKYRAVERWAYYYTSRVNTEMSLRQAMTPFMKYIGFHQIPTQLLMREIKPLRIVPDDILMKALAFQADPGSINFEELIETPLSPKSKYRLLAKSGTVLNGVHWGSSTDVKKVVTLHHSPEGSCCDSGFHDDDIAASLKRGTYGSATISSSKSKSCTDVSCNSITYLKL